MKFFSIFLFQLYELFLGWISPKVIIYLNKVLFVRFLCIFYCLRHPCCVTHRNVWYTIFIWVRIKNEIKFAHFFVALFLVFFCAFELGLSNSNNKPLMRGWHFSLIYFQRLKGFSCFSAKLKLFYSVCHITFPPASEWNRFVCHDQLSCLTNVSH